MCEKYSCHSGETEEASRKNFSYRSSTKARFAGFTIKSVAIIELAFGFHLKRGDDLARAIGIERKSHGFADEFRRRHGPGNRHDAIGGADVDVPGGKVGVADVLGLDDAGHTAIEGGVLEGVAR